MEGGRPVRAAAAVALLLSGLAAPSSGAPAIQIRPPAPIRAAPAGDPVIAAGDEAYARRQDGRVGAVASSGPILEAIERYQTAAQAPDGIEARWKLARALYFRGRYTGLDGDARRAVFEKARRVSEEALGILYRRATSLAGRDPEKLSPAERAEAVRADPDAAPALFWASVAWGEWALAAGKLKAARAGAAEKIRGDAATLVALDPSFEEGGGYRVLGRLHDQAPKVPFLTGWVSRAEGLRNLRLAMRVNNRNFVNRHFLAEALARGGAGERAEAIRLERGLLADAPSPLHLVEELAIQEEAKRNIQAWTRK